MKLYRLCEAAEITGLSIATWRSWVLHQKIGVVRLGRSVRIPEDELGRIVCEGTTPARKTETAILPKSATTAA